MERPPTIRSYIKGSTIVATLDEALVVHNQILTVIKNNLQQAQIRMKSQENSHHRDRDFKIEDWVWLRLQPYMQNIMCDRCFSKLSKRFFGPYPISKHISQLAYKLYSSSLPCLKPKLYHGNLPTTIPVMDFFFVGTMVPLQILDSRLIHTKKGTVT
ncbi:uncharacterized protein [Medicago truncatula]|uniref:uncharacterized protein n=1 Tax=Medicago truncatula TaxID=3880 RepID=UPI000D2F16FE|nr:uncharacterized protein LOC112420746 [Medicago truncatula]